MRLTLKRRRPIEILLVDDNLGDVELAYEAFQGGGMNKQLHMVRNGEDALDFLYQRGKHQAANRPDIILMDINMPRASGKEVLSIIKQDNALKDIPVIMLTSSEAEGDIKDSYKLQANAYIVKPDTLDQLRNMVTLIESFWLDVAVLPAQAKRG